MALEVVTTKTYICDRCKNSVQAESQPSHANDPWGTLMIDQPSGFDMQGCPWAPRMRTPLLLCSRCIEAIVAVVNAEPPTEAEGNGDEWLKLGRMGNHSSPMRMIQSCDGVVVSPVSFSDVHYAGINSLRVIRSAGNPQMMFQGREVIPLYAKLAILGVMG